MILNRNLFRHSFTIWRIIRIELTKLMYLIFAIELSIKRWLGAYLFVNFQ